MSRGRDRKRKRQQQLSAARKLSANQPRIYKDEMGLFKEYLSRNAEIMPKIDHLRREQLAKIGQLRDSAVITYVARIAPLPAQVDASVAYDDLLYFNDVLGELSGERVTVILETHGGAGEVGKNIVELLHEKFDHVSFLVPGTAKSTGTIMCLGGHEILMGPGSSLGPIDAQLIQNGKQFSADAFIEGFGEIKKEVDASGKLNPAYIPMLQRISPGELQAAHNALEFARATVAEWLAKYKFANWDKPEEKKRERAREIAHELARQSKWFSHGHSIRIPALTELGLKIDDFSQNAALNDAVLRYQVLLRMTFEQAPVYKIIETPTSTIARRFQVPAINPEQVGNILGQLQSAASVQVGLKCGKCGTDNTFQLDFTPQPLQPGSRRFPNGGTAPCQKCGQTLNLAPARTDLEGKMGRKAMTPQPTN